MVDMERLNRAHKAQAIREGRAAARRGTDFTANPWRIGRHTELHRMWLRGWRSVLRRRDTATFMRQRVNSTVAGIWQAYLAQ